MPIRDYSRSIVWVLMKAVALVPKQSKKKCTKHTEATCNLLLAFQLFCYPVEVSSLCTACIYCCRSLQSLMHFLQVFRYKLCGLPMSLKGTAPK